MVTITNPVLDFMAKRGSEDRAIDLKEIFAGEGLTYTVTSSDPTVAAVTIDGDMLTIDFLDTLGSTDLKITATDAGGASVTDNVRVLLTGENAYTIAVLPDTQDYTNAARIETFKGMTQWLVDNKDSLNIQFVTHVGDITTENGSGHWEYAEQALSILNGKIPYGLTLGNHDGVSSSYSASQISTYFSIDYLKAANGENFGGVYDQEPELTNNSYSTFTAPDGTKWLVLNLEFGARQDVVRWAGEVIEDHLDHRVILTTHSYMTWAGRHDATGAPLYDEGTGYDYGLGNSPESATDGETMYRELVQKYPNVAFTFSGHIFGDGAETLVSYDQFGNPVHQMMVNYQNGVSTEITGDAGQASPNNGGNGAIRLITIDPENNQVYTSTYFAALDDYMDSVRADGEGLDGPYLGHQEILTGIDLSTPELVAIAKAGNDQFVSADAGADKAEVTLDGDWTLNPGEDAGLSYSWTDRDGNVVATGATPTLQLGAGQHALTLTVTDSAGRVSTDEVRIVVSTERTLLVDNFNDGDAAGWTRPGPAVTLSTGAPEEYGIAPLPGTPAVVADDFAKVPASTGTQGLKLTADFDVAEGSLLASYSVVFDIYVPGDTAGGYTGLLQIDGGGTSADAELFLRTSGEAAGIGTMQVYQGNFTYDAWHRVAITFSENGDGSLTLSKYIDGVLAGSQSVSGDRYKLDPEKGLVLFADDDGETSDLFVSSVLLTDKVFTAAEIAEMGAAKAGGILSSAPSANAVQFDFNAGDATASFGTGSLAPQGGQTLGYDSQEDFDIAALPGAASEGGGEADVTFVQKLTTAQGLHFKPAQALPAGTVVSSYTLIYDLLIPSATASGFTSFLQISTANNDDGDLFVRDRGDGTGGLGIGGVYEGNFQYDQWQRVAFKIVETNSGYTISKFIDGVKISDQQVGQAGRYDIDLSKGVLLFSDEDGETSNLYVSSVLFTDKVYTDQEIAALGGVKAGGIVETAPTEFSSQIDFSTPSMTDTFGNATVTAGAIGTGSGSFIVKGTAASRDTTEDGQAAPEGRVYEQSDTPNNVMLWSDASARNWSDYEFETTLKTTDNDGIGVLFYYQDAGSHYKVVLDAETNTRSLIRVSNGTETVLASEHGGTPWSRDFQLKVVAVDGAITVFIDDHNVFGTVVDAAPLAGGTVGLYSNNQRSSQFDNVTVNKIELTAHAGDNGRVVDFDGDGAVEVALNGSGSYGLADIASYVWKDAEGNVVAEGETATAQLDAGRHVLTLTVTDAGGRSATDTVVIEAVAKERVMLSETFGSAGSLASWTIVDEGTEGGVGPDGTASQWELREGALVQLSDLKSKQLVWNGASNGDDWKKGWSPLGDGVNVLRKGTYALYNDADALDWSDYAVETTIATPDNGAVGVLFYYQDANNYYKLELDANGDYDRNPSNGAGSLFQLIQVKDGIEKYLNQFPAKYTPGETFDLRVEVKDNKIQAYVDDMKLFAYAIEDHAQTKGTVGLFAWDSAGVSFDNVSVISLADGETPEPGENEAPVAGDDAGFTSSGGEILIISAALLLANDADADADTLSLLSVGNAVGGTVVLDDAGNVLFKPAAGFSGAASFTYTVSDGKGGVDTATVSLDVTAPANHTPDAVNDRVYALQDKALTISLASLQANDTDLDGDVLTIVSVQDASSGTVALVDGKVVFTPAEGFTGDASFTYTVSDGKGGEDTATVTVTVNPQPNVAPVAGDDHVYTLQDKVLTISLASLQANDSDADADTLSVISVANGTGGTVALDGTNVVFTPAEGFTGEASFTYTVSDGKGGQDTATVTVTVNPQPNVAPVAGDDSGFQTTAGTALTLAAAALLANDTDANADTLSIVSVANGTGGTVSLNGTNVVFTPAEGFTGEASFTYTVSDGKGGQDTATVALNVTAAPNRAPVAANDSFQATAGIAATLAAAVLLANDSDADADTLSIVSVESGTGGTVSLDGTNVVFTPAQGFTGEAAFSYTISDGKGGTATATVTVNVQAAGPQDPYEGWTKGTSGNDILRAEPFEDGKLYGDDGDDLISGGFGNDVLEGGAGDDRLDGNFGDDILRGGAGDDQLYGGFGNDLLEGGAGDDRLHGGDGDDILRGGEGNDELIGGFGNDVLEGGAGDDRLDGGFGDDVINGGIGNDLLSGGFGADRFVFAESSGVDLILDFEVGIDTVELVDLGFETYADIVAAMVDTDAGVVIQLDDSGDNMVLIQGVTRAALSSDDFSIV